MSTEFPRGIEVCVGSIIRRGDKILMINSPKWQGKLGFPGGHIEPGELMLAAAEREALEETGLVVKAVEVSGWAEMMNPPEFYRPIHLMFFDVVCDYVNGEFKLQDDEATAAEWLSLEQLETANVISPDKISIAKYKLWLEQRV